jgi:hypothetical protein
MGEWFLTFQRIMASSPYRSLSSEDADTTVLPIVRLHSPVMGSYIREF